MEENSTADDDSQISVSKDKMKHVVGLDLPGHFNFRARLHESVETAEAIILVLDSKDRTKIPESAEILYDILNNITVLDRKVPILVVCNKQD